MRYGTLIEGNQRGRTYALPNGRVGGILADVENIYDAVTGIFDNTKAPSVMMFDTEAERDTFAAEVAARFPNRKVQCFVIDTIFQAPPSAAIRQRVTAQGVLPA